MKQSVYRKNFAKWIYLAVNVHTKYQTEGVVLNWIWASVLILASSSTILVHPNTLLLTFSL